MKKVALESAQKGKEIHPFRITKDEFLQRNLRKTTDIKVYHMTDSIYN